MEVKVECRLEKGKCSGFELQVFWSFILVLLLEFLYSLRDCVDDVFLVQSSAFQADNEVD